MKSAAVEDESFSSRTFLRLRSMWSSIPWYLRAQLTYSGTLHSAPTLPQQVMQRCTHESRNLLRRRR